MENKLLIGSHVSMSSPEYYVGTVKEAISYGSTTFMFYTGAPQNLFRQPTSSLKIEEGRALLLANGFDESKIVVHAPYIINIANTVKPDTYLLGVQALISELKRVEDFHCKILVLHPGSHVGAGSEAGCKKIVEGLNLALAQVNNDVKIALETMAGKGGEVGSNIDELKYIIDHCLFKDRLGVCLDTCHLSDGGLLSFGFDRYLEEFDEKIGLDKILVVHVNDSKNLPNSHKDRHENLGYGEIGFDFLNSVVHHPKLVNVPKILETPYINDKPPYKKEIEMLKKGQFEPGWKDSF